MDEQIIEAYQRVDCYPASGVLRPFNKRRINTIAEASILVVDDDPKSLKQIENYLCHYGLLNNTLERGLLKAIKKVIVSPPDLFIIDYSFHRIGGIQAAHLLKGLSLSSAPVIYLVSSDKDFRELTAMAHPKTRILMRPLYRESFIQAVRELLFNNLL